ncbi:hypothetical protein [Rhodococcus sp. NPDC058521]|uniref:Rv3212 family protein n=1 Tax=Rhodococcus sp. NPDC058521 TaxID=3346536 RepID=UPI0036659642
MLAPERRTRVDLIVAAAIVIVLVVVAAVVWFRSDARGTTSVTNETPPEAAETVLTVPETLEPVWEATSSATDTPVVAAKAVVVTADGGTVIGRDRTTGDEVWRYERDIDLCGAVAAWDEVVAVYRDDRGCSQVTALAGGTGVLEAQRNSDADQAVAVSNGGTYVVSRGDSRMELWRSDLVRTVEYGRVDAPINPNKQPRSGCVLRDAATSSSRTAVLERCPGEQADRLTILSPAPEDGQEPEEYGSSVLADLDVDAGGARILAVEGDTTAVYLPAGATAGDRIGVYGGDGEEVSVTPLPRPVGPEVLTSSTPEGLTWWTGTEVMRLNQTDLHPDWAFVGAIGPGAAMGSNFLVPVPTGIAVLDGATGRPLRTIPVDRGDYEGPVTTSVVGDVILEQRGDTVVALR